MYPDCDEILKLANDYDIIPVCREIYADVITPITLLRKLSGISNRYYLLESIEGGRKMGTLSFLRIRSGDACFLQRGRGNHRKGR